MVKYSRSVAPITSSVPTPDTVNRSNAFSIGELSAVRVVSVP